MAMVIQIDQNIVVLEKKKKLSISTGNSLPLKQEDT
jgi:hypothetical protein